MKKPLISVIIPAYNEEKLIGACLTALRRQETNYPCEIIVVNNNSSDKTSTIAKKHYVKFINEPRQGRFYARQTGANSARGEILAFTEADCVVPSNWIDTIATYLDTHQNVVGLSGSYHFRNTNLVLDLLGPISLRITSIFYRLIQGNHTFRAANFAVRKKIFTAAGGFNPRAVPYDDVELGIRAGKYGPIHFLPKFSVLTSDRRFRGRLFKFFWEFLTAYPRVILLGQQGSDHYYEVIR